MECVAYLRVSTEKQAEEGYGLDLQRISITDYCRKNELIISDWYIDDGYTGSNMDRPQLQRLIRDCSKKRIKCLVAFKLDRISRSMVDGIYMIERVFQPNGVDFRCVYDSVSYDSPMEQAYTQMMAVFAQLDKNTMMMRMRGGRLERVKKGYWYGGGNRPYCYDYSREKGILVPIPERAEQANRALDLFLQGYSDERIMKICGYSSELLVRHILTGVVNIGMIPYKGEIYKGLHEPIFDERKFELAQEYRKTRRKTKTACFSMETNLLTGLCYCGICGCKMRYQKWTNGNQKIYCYSHDRSLKKLPNHNPGCDNTLEWAKDIEKQVEEEILKISLNISSYQKTQKESELEITKKALEKNKAKLKRLYNFYAEGNDTIVDSIRETEDEINKQKEVIFELQKSEGNKQSKEIVYDKIKSLADVWPHIDKTSKNVILKTIISKIVIVKGNVEIQLKEF